MILARIVEVSDTYSKARLLSASGEATPVIIGADNLAAKPKALVAVILRFPYLEVLMWNPVI